MNVDPHVPHRRPDPAWWTESEMREALRHRDIALVIKLLRRNGMTQRRIAELAGLANSEIYEITAKGRQVLAYDVLERIAEGLGIPRGLMGLAYDAPHQPRVSGPTPRLGDPDERQRFVSALAGFAVDGAPDVTAWLPQFDEWSGPVPEKVTSATVATIRDITDRHRRLDALHGGGSCRDSALGYLVWARCLLRADCPSDDLAAALRRELADLHNLIGWMSHDLGEHTEARQHLAQGLVFAREAHDATLLADAYYRLGRVSIHEEHAREALHLWQLGQIVATNSGCHTSVAILHANISWAHAALGDARAVRDSLARAVDELGRAGPEPAPQWTAFFSEADLEGMSGVVHAALARHREHRDTHAGLAIEHASRALRQRTDVSRSGALDHVTAAMGHALLGSDADVVPHAAAAVHAARGTVLSRRLLDRLDRMADVAEPLAARNSELRDVVSEIRVLAAA